VGLTNLGRDLVAADIIGEAITEFNNANGALGVGNSSAAFDPTHTNLQGASRLRRAMDATFPTRATNVVTAKSTFAPADANFDWAEWGWFNNTTDAAGTMFSRFVQAFGTKPSTQTWILTSTLTFTNPP